MPDNTKVVDRDQALIGILERLANEMEQQDKMLEDLISRHGEFAKTVESAEMNRRAKQIDNDQAHDKLFDSFHHYRSDMLSLVNEQDHINKNIADLQKTVRDTIYALETTNQRLAGLDERLKQQEKISSDHYAHALKQAEVFQRELTESNRNFAKLHADTEKHLSELHKETEQQLDKSQHETMRRLLTLDGIVNSLQTLLIRTEPPEKKPPLIKRLLHKINIFFRIRLPLLLRRKSKQTRE